MQNNETVASIERMLADLDKGFQITHNRVKPHILTRTRDTLQKESDDSIFYLFNDLSGEAISVAAGTVPMGGDAINAFIHAQAKLFVLNRDVDEAGKALSAVLQRHEQDLLHWVKHGIINQHPNCDLSLIGQEFLVTTLQRANCPATAISLSIARTLRHYLGDDHGYKTSH